jgi:hypothetical protein
VVRAHTVVDRYARSAHHVLFRGRLGRVLRAVVLTSFDEDSVIEVLEALERAQVTAHVAGGWGVDALLGTKRREHSDLDLVVDNTAEIVEMATRSLASVGYKGAREYWVDDSPMPRRIVLRDVNGRTIDLHPVQIDADEEDSPASTVDVPIARWNRDAFTVGSIGGRPVSCLSASMQLTVLAPISEPAEHHRIDAAALISNYGPLRQAPDQ